MILKNGLEIWQEKAFGEGLELVGIPPYLDFRSSVTSHDDYDARILFNTAYYNLDILTKKTEFKGGSKIRFLYTDNSFANIEVGGVCWDDDITKITPIRRQFSQWFRGIY